MRASLIPARIRPLTACLAGIAAGLQALPLPGWAHILLGGLTAFAAAEGIIPSRQAQTTIQAAQKGPWQ